MRKQYFLITLLMVAIVAVVWGIVALLNHAQDYEEAKQNTVVQDVYENEVAITTVSEEQKVSPNSGFALKKYYDECSHFDYEEAELPKELVNLTRQEVEDYYDDWEVEEFTENNLVLTKEINGYCNQHFLIKLDGDYINVYRLGTWGELNEYKKTDISRDYLPEEDIESLETGIPVYGEGKLSSALEDYE